MRLKLLRLLIILFLFSSLGYILLLSYPYLYSKINRHDSLGFFSTVEEHAVDFKFIPSKDRKIDQFNNHLLKGDKVSAKLKSSENNFGITLIKFSRFGKISDKVVFRIKEEGQKNWYYEHAYKADQFQSNQYFTFGFPSIINSKNNNYYFEVESLEGKYNDGVGLSFDKPNVAFVYKYTRNDLKNYNTLFSFMKKKLIFAAGNINLIHNWLILAFFAAPFILVIFIENKKMLITSVIRFLPHIKKNHINIFKTLEKKITHISKNTTRWFTSTKFYLVLLNTNIKKRLAVGLFIFLLALIYRYSYSLVNLDKLYYAGLGGQGDYDQFIRASTCGITSFCKWILHQNLLIESLILGSFYEIFGFIGGLKLYLYLMVVLSSIIATIPYFLLSRKNWISIAGIIGGLLLATNNFLTNVALNFPPDNGSVFFFSMFFLIYLLTMRFKTIRWLLVFGFAGFFDGMFKALFLINDLVAFILFIPVFFFENLKEKSSSIFIKKNIKLLFLSLLPFLVFMVLYSAWEYFVYIKFNMYYFLRGLVQTKGESYVAYTSFENSSLAESIGSQLFYLGVSGMVMIKRLIEYIDLQTIFLAPIFIGMLFFSFIRRTSKTKFTIIKFLVLVIYSAIIIILLTLIKNDYFGIHQMFAGEYIIDRWNDQTYVEIFIFAEIIILFVLSFGYKSLKFSLPILPYVIMLIILTKNSPFPRISVHVVVWTIILFSFLLSWLLSNISLLSNKKTNKVVGLTVLILFTAFYMLPKTSIMITNLYSGIKNMQKEVKYLQWVNSELPHNTVILAGGKSDLVTVAENIKVPIAYSTLWSAAVLIRPNKIPGVAPRDFSIISELKNKRNFQKNRYIILDEDISVWQSRVSGIGDGIFSVDTKLSSTLHGEDYSIKVYKSNEALKKAVYELQIREKPLN